MATEVTTTTTTAPPAAAAPNPEALEDAPRAQPEARFQNVDLEANTAAGSVPTTSPPTIPAATTTPVEKSAFTQAASHMDWGVLNLLLSFCAITEMISASTVCGGGVSGLGFVYLGAPCTGILGYQVSVGTISAFIALVCAILFHAGKIPDRKHQELVSLFQFLWWIAGTVTLTFFGSFQSTAFANGYFATWGAFFFSAMMLIAVSPVFQHSVDQAAHSVRQPLIFLVVASAVVMGAAIDPCSPSSACVSYNAWALSLGTISLGISLILLVAAPKISNQVLRFIAIFFVLWWVVGFAVVTFGGPFVSTGNGYFASVAAVFASVGFLQMVNANA